MTRLRRRAIPRRSGSDVVLVREPDGWCRDWQRFAAVLPILKCWSMPEPNRSIRRRRHRLRDPLSNGPVSKLPCRSAVRRSGASGLQPGLCRGLAGCFRVPRRCSASRSCMRMAWRRSILPGLASWLERQWPSARPRNLPALQPIVVVVIDAAVAGLGVGLGKLRLIEGYRGRAPGLTLWGGRNPSRCPIISLRHRTKRGSRASPCFATGCWPKPPRAPHCTSSIAFCGPSHACSRR